MSEPDRSPEAAPFYVRPLDKKMGLALARRTVFREQDQQDWGKVAERVAAGNTSLVPGSEADYAPMRDAIARGALLMSGRHLQHGDLNQRHRPMEVYTNCFSRDTKILTLEHGPAKIGTLVGQTVTVKSRDGQWRPAEVKSYGRQPLFKYQFGAWNANSTGYKLSVVATANHRWFLKDGSVTTSLKVGDFLEVATTLKLAVDSTAVTHGILYGDGSAHKRRHDYDRAWVSQGRTYASIRVCKTDSARNEILTHLTAQGYSYKTPPHAKGDPVFYIGKFPFIKELPFTTDPEYINSFIYGWWLADGSKTYNRNTAGGGIEISTSNEEAVDWLRNHAAYAGYIVTGISVHARKEADGSYANGKTLYSVRLAKGVERKVFSIEDVGEDEVFCVEEPVTSGFVLANGLLTGNCSTAATSFMTFYLLLNGSGVGRDYSDAMMLVDWEQAPELVLVCRKDHPNFDSAVFKEPQEALQLLLGKSHTYFMVPDSREGWAMAAERYETMAYQGTHADDTLVLDFSYVRPAGSPIAGMQNRPASGPVPTAQAFAKIAQVKGQGLPRWKQAMLVDHALAECVVVGGARRSARMSTKYWGDPGAIDFAHIKAQHGLWSSNNSIIATKSLFEGLKNKNSWAQQVFKAVTEASYWDLTGEPGFICVDNFAPDPIDYSLYADGAYMGSELYQLHPATKAYTAALAQAAQKMPYSHLTNPCVTADTWIQTTEGPRQVSELIGQPFKALVGQHGYAATGFFQTGVKPVFRIETQRGYSLRLTDNHKVLVERSRKRVTGESDRISQEWVEVKDLQPGDKLVIDNHRGTHWMGEGSFEEGWLLGQMVGDGGYNANSQYKAYVRFWGPHQEKLQALSMQYALAAGMPMRSDATGIVNTINKTSQVSLQAFNTLAAQYLTPQGKQLLPQLEKTSSGFYRGFLRGFFDADGTVLNNAEKGSSVRLAQSDWERLCVVQRMLARLGIASSLYANRRAAGQSLLPDGQGGQKLYDTKATHELVVSRDNMGVFAEVVGFNDPDKAAKLEAIVSRLGVKRSVYRDHFTSRVTRITPDGVEPVYDCTVEKVHRFDANGLVVHNCGEISLNILGGFCVIGDVVPYHCETLEQAEETFRIATRALIRVNTMRSVYTREVARTNRIGVSFTGIHEFAFKQFGLGFREVLDEHGAGKPFWEAMARFARAVKAEARAYATELGMAVPVTDTTVKPAGSTSKLFALSEGAHLPSMKEYLRNMQFRSDDPLVEQYRAKGYPVRELQTYQGTSIVGFPTQPTICRLGMGDKLVTAPEATPEEQYQWLMLLEKYWVRGVDAQGQPLPDTGNQISYTLKYDPAKVSYKDFIRMMVKYQSRIRCCSVMPATDTSAYEYLPEQPFKSVGHFQSIIEAITDPEALEDIDMEHLQCQSGACPI